MCSCTPAGDGTTAGRVGGARPLSSQHCPVRRRPGLAGRDGEWRCAGADNVVSASVDKNRRAAPWVGATRQRAGPAEATSCAKRTEAMHGRGHLRGTQRDRLSTHASARVCMQRRFRPARMDARNLDSGLNAVWESLTILPARTPTRLHARLHHTQPHTPKDTACIAPGNYTGPPLTSCCCTQAVVRVLALAVTLASPTCRACHRSKCMLQL